MFELYVKIEGEDRTVMMATVTVRTIESRTEIRASTCIFTVIVFSDFSGCFWFFLNALKFGAEEMYILLQLKVFLFQKTNFLIFLSQDLTYLLNLLVQIVVVVRILDCILRGIDQNRKIVHSEDNKLEVLKRQSTI